MLVPAGRRQKVNGTTFKGMYTDMNIYDLEAIENSIYEFVAGSPIKATSHYYTGDMDIVGGISVTREEGVALSYRADGEVSTIFLSGHTDDDPSVLEGVSIDTVIAEQGDCNEVVLRIGDGETMIALSGVNAGMIAEM